MQAHKNILYVLPSYGWGGAELQTMHQLNYLTQKGNNNIFFLNLSNIIDGIDTIKLPKEKIIICDKSNIQTVAKAPVKTYLYLIRQTIKAVNQFLVTDIIAILPLSHLVCRVVKIYFFLFKWKKIRLYTYYRDPDYQFYKEKGSFFKLYVKATTLLAIFADNFSIFNSKTSYKNVKKYSFVIKPHVIDNCLPLMEVKENKAVQYLESENIKLEGAFSILFPGRFMATKGHLFFFTAMQKFIANNNLLPYKFKIIIAGYGSDKIADDEIKKGANAIREYVYFTGMIENDLMLSLMKAVNLVVIPSINEGFGNVAIEGLMQKSLLLTSNAGGLKNIVEHEKSGYQFEAGNEEDFLTKVEFIYFNYQHLPIKKTDIFERYLQKYSIKHYFEKLNEYYPLNFKI